MAAPKDSSVYYEVVRVTHVYLGPAADRFIARQVENHLHKSPTELSRSDLLALIDWIRVVVALITEDSDIIDEYVSELTKLTKEPDKSKRKAKQKR